MRRPGVSSSRTAETLTPTLLASSLIGRVWKTTWRALKLLPSGPAAVSALARLDETVLSRWLCALTALPETWKILSRDIIAP